MARRSRGLSGELAEIARLADAKSRFKELAGSLAQKLESVVEILFEADRVLGKIQTHTEASTSRKGKRGRPKGSRSRKPGRPKGTGKRGRPKGSGKKAGKKAVAKRGRPAGTSKKSLSSQLKDYRKAANLNQGELAEKLGVHIASVRGWEQGRTSPRKAQIAKILEILKTPVKKVEKPAKPRKAGRPRKNREVAETAQAPAQTEAPAQEEAKS